MDRWIGKIAVVTGASAGLGAAISKKLVEEGINVVGFARRKERIEELSKGIQGKNGAKLYALKVDITKEEEILKGFEHITENIGPVSILINNAGIAQPTTLIDGETARWKKVLDTNVLGLCIATREAAKIMRKNNIDGHIIHINSIAGHRVPKVPYTNVYSASKYAVTSLSETLLNELRCLGSRIKVTVSSDTVFKDQSLSPGFVESEIVEVNGFLENETIREVVKTAPRMYPIDIANAVTYVLGTPPHFDVKELTLQPVGEIV